MPDPNYRLYLLNSEGHVVAAQELAHCKDDLEAIAAVEARPIDCQRELWDAARRVRAWAHR